MKKPVFTGAAVAIITPFKSTGEVDYEEFGKIIDHQIAHGTDAIVVCGTTGEASALHDKEHREAIAWCCEYVNHRVPVVAGTGSNDTAYAIELTKFAAECGADAGLSVTPYYNKTTQRGLIAHYTAIADCCDLPIVLYNVPSRTGVCFTADTLYELSKHPNINGLKAASGNFSLLAEAMAKCGDNLNVWSGNDDQIVPMMSLGAKGVMEDDALVILCEDRMTFILAQNDKTLAVIREQAAKLAGAPLKVRVREAGDEIIQEKNDMVEELIDHAKDLDVDIKTL